MKGKVDSDDNRKTEESKLHMNNKIHNHKYLEEYRRELRNNLTSAEATLWTFLQKKKLKGRKFRRQHSIKNYIVDFYCASEKLIIELDGAYHLGFAQQNYDNERTKVLNELGFKVLRFENKLVFENSADVLEEIRSHFKD